MKLYLAEVSMKFYVMAGSLKEAQEVAEENGTGAIMDSHVGPTIRVLKEVQAGDEVVSECRGEFPYIAEELTFDMTIEEVIEKLPVPDTHTEPMFKD